MRDERTGCTWAPRRGTRRLLYDCVWLVSASQSSPQILLRVRLAPLAVSLHCRPRLANCASLGSSSSSQARFPSPGLVGCKSRKHKSGGGLRARASCAASAISHTLANLTTWRLLRRLSEDSNLVDPASSHMLVSKIKPCMSKYKWYTMKLRMAH